MCRILFVLIILNCSFLNLYSDVETVKLAVPKLLEDKITSGKIGTRSFHRTPFHLTSEVHYRSEKPVIIIHNYRDGEAGWTYAPGRMEVSYENMRKAYSAANTTVIPKEEKIAIVGAGAHGLMLANKLAKIGHPVTIYAKSFSPNTFSDTYASIFMPLLDDKNMGADIEHLEMLSYMAYESWINPKHSDGYRGVVPVDLYFINDNGSFNHLVKKGLIPKGTPVDLAFDDDKKIPAVKYKSFGLDTPLIMKEMMNRSKQLGVKFVDKKISSVADCLKLEENVVFNCIGLGSNEIFFDDEEIPFVCHAACLQDASANNYVVYAAHLDGTDTYWLTNNNKTTMSGTFLALDRNNSSESIAIKRLSKRFDALLE